MSEVQEFEPQIMSSTLPDVLVGMDPDNVRVIEQYPRERIDDLQMELSEIWMYDHMRSLVGGTPFAHITDRVTDWLEAHQYDAAKIGITEPIINRYDLVSGQVDPTVNRWHVDFWKQYPDYEHKRVFYVTARPPEFPARVLDLPLKLRDQNHPELLDLAAQAVVDSSGLWRCGEASPVLIWDGESTIHRRPLITPGQEPVQRTEVSFHLAIPRAG